MATAARVYAQLLYSFFAADMPIDRYRRIQELAAALPCRRYEHSCDATANRVRAGLSQRWREFFREWDVVVCPTWQKGHDIFSSGPRRKAGSGRSLDTEDGSVD